MAQILRAGSTFMTFLLALLFATAGAIPVATSSSPTPAVTIDSSGAVVIWRDDDATRAARVAIDATTPMPSLQLDSGPYRDAGAASIGDQSLVVWLRNDDVWAQRIGGDGKAIGPPIYLAFVDSRHTQRIGVAASRDRYLIVIAITSRIVAALVDTNGQVIAYQIPIMDGEFDRYVERVTAASNGETFYVVWDASTNEPWTTPCTVGCPGEDRDVHGVVLNGDGTPRKSTERLIAAGGEPDVTSNGSDYFVVWSRFGGGISGAPVAATGDVGQTVDFTGGEFGPRVVWNGSAYDVSSVRAAGPTLVTTRAESIAGVYPREFAVASRLGRTVLSYPQSGQLVLRYLVQSVGKRRASRH
jgi:hypothetical protein